MNTVGTPLLWGGFAVVVTIMLAIDLLLQGRRGAHAMTMKQAAAWSLVWVTLSLLFNAAFWWYLVQTEGRAVADPQALAFLTGYLIEKSLAVDNVFVWLMLFSYFSVPAALQRRVLVYGVLGAIVLRTIMIFTGSWLISQFDWILYIFGAFLLFTGVKMALAHEDESGIGDKPLVRWLRGHLRMTDTIDNEHFFVRKNGLLYATPLMLVLILVELSDVIFAVEQYSGYLRRDHRSVYCADLKPVCDPRPACDVFPAGRCGRAFLDAQIWSGGDSGVYRYQDADCRLLPYSDRCLAGRGVWHSGDDVYYQRLGELSA